MAQDHIDSLLERYLALLDEYTQLREELSRCQADAFHSLARANFSAERSMRFGRDHYDDRMQASRKFDITERDGDRGGFEVVSTAKVQEAGNAADDETSNQDANAEEENQDETEDKKTRTSKEKKPVDPLFWFGGFPSTHLRNVQAHSIKAVETIIPRLVTVNTEMQHIEIEVRRARKKMAKAAEKQTKAEPQPAPAIAEAS